MKSVVRVPHASRQYRNEWVVNGLLWPQQHLHANVCDPSWLVVGGRDGLEAAPAHQQQVQRPGFIERLYAAETESGLALLGKAGGEVADALAGGDTVGVLLVVELDVGPGAVGVGEIVADDEAAPPTLGHGVVAEVVADLAVVADGADAAIDLDGQIEVGAGRDQAARDGARRVVEEELGVGADAEVGERLGRFGRAGRLGGRLRSATEDAEQAGAEAAAQGGIAWVVLVKAPLDAEQALAEAAQDRAGDGGLGGGGGLGARLLDGDGDLVLELDAVAEAVVVVEVGDLVGTGGGIAVADPAEVDLPMLIAGGLGVVGAEGGGLPARGPLGRAEPARRRLRCGPSGGRIFLRGCVRGG